ncbi:MAG TPA: alpha-E domain-containing protein [Blastocatellia bacterium]
MLSRVADSLYWMSRYPERAEHTARVVDVYLNRALDLPDGSDSRRWNILLECLNAQPLTQSQAGVHHEVRPLIFDSTNQSSLAFCIEHARENARQVREQISSEMWEQLNQLFLYIMTTSRDDGWQAEPHRFFKTVKEGSHLFQGIADSTMNHAEGWDFIQVGRFLERACAVAKLLDSHYRALSTAADKSESLFDHVDWIYLLKSCTAFEPFCKVYTCDVDPRSITEFLLLSSEFPHSVRFSIEMVQSELMAIAESAKARGPGRATRLAGWLLATLSYGQIEEVMADGINLYLSDVLRRCSDIHSAFYETYIAYPIDSTRLRLVGN